MKTNPRITALLAVLALLLPALTLLANQDATVSDLTGQWHGTNHFSGISYAENTQKQVTAQDIEIVLHFATDGKVTGLVGGAALSGSVTENHRGWFWRLLGTKSDNFLIQGQIVGPVVPRSESGSHPINAPFTLNGTRITGTLFATYPIKYPYPFLSIRLTR